MHDIEDAGKKRANYYSAKVCVDIKVSEIRNENGRTSSHLHEHCHSKKTVNNKNTGCTYIYKYERRKKTI
jgi:hypothetical protein